MIFPLPPLIPIRQSPAREELSAAGEAVFSALEEGGFSARISPGMRVAVTAGSRGIDRIPEVLRAVAEWLHGHGAIPFLLTAMGSHGGGTPEGREEILRGLGISEQTLAAEIRTDGETRLLGEVRGVPVYTSALAAAADGVVIVNRIKPHTSFSGRYESGLCKMLVTGLGQTAGATAFHSQGPESLSLLLPAMAELVLKSIRVVFGLALIENNFNRLCRVAALAGEEILEGEPGLLEEARTLAPALPFAEADVLVVDRMGKDISGTGLDTNVIGRRGLNGRPDPPRPRLSRIVVLRLSPATQGSAYGIGLADVTTAALLHSMDPGLTLANALASTFLERARLPLAFPSDREAILAALKTCGNPDPGRLKLARISDTLHLEHLLVSAPLVNALSRPCHVCGPPQEWDFDEHGNLALQNNGE